MKNFEVQSILIQAPFEKVFRYIADAQNLPEWTSAFKSVSGGRALMETPNGRVEINLEVIHSLKHGTIDWKMSFPDGNISVAHSRVLDADNLGTFIRETGSSVDKYKGPDSIELPQRSSRVDQYEGPDSLKRPEIESEVEKYKGPISLFDERGSRVKKYKGPDEAERQIFILPEPVADAIAVIQSARSNFLNRNHEDK